MGGLTVYSVGVQALVEKGHRKITPFFIPYAITNMGSTLLAVDLGLMGPNYSISTACATSNYCFYAAANHIRQGKADLMLDGGTETAIQPIGSRGFVACKALSQRDDEPQTASRPWDKDRDGFVMGEGARVLSQHEQSENQQLWSENDKLRADNISFKEAPGNATVSPAQFRCTN